MTANNINSYLDYLDGLVDEYNNICICSIGIKTVNASYSALPEVLNQIIKFLTLMFLIQQELQSIRTFFVKVYWSVFNTNIWTYTFKDLNGKKH